MVTICENFGREHNLIFSIDPIPVKSKTNCVITMCGNNTSNYLEPVLFDGKQVPWVQKTEHLGQIFHQNLSVESDSYRRRACFMPRSSDCRDSLHFAYGGLLYDFRSDYVECLFKA